MAELLARGRVADVHLHEKAPRARKHRTGVAQRVGVMRERPGVDDHVPTVVHGPVNPVNEVCLAIGLTNLDAEPEPRSPLADQRDEIVVRRRAVDSGLARAEAPEVGSVQDEDGARGRGVRRRGGHGTRVAAGRGGVAVTR